MNVNRIREITVDVGNVSGVAAILFGQHRLRHVLVQRVDCAVEVDSLTDLLLEERLHEVDDRVDHR